MKKISARLPGLKSQPTFCYQGWNFQSCLPRWNVPCNWFGNLALGWKYYSHMLTLRKDVLLSKQRWWLKMKLGDKRDWDGIKVKRQTTWSNFKGNWMSVWFRAPRRILLKITCFFSIQYWNSFMQYAAGKRGRLLCSLVLIHKLAEYCRMFAEDWPFSYSNRWLNLKKFHAVDWTWLFTFHIHKVFFTTTNSLNIQQKVLLIIKIVLWVYKRTFQRDMCTINTFKLLNHTKLQIPKSFFCISAN